MGIEVEKRPCWTATCDICEEALASEDGGCLHLADEKDARDAAEGQSWAVLHGVLICAACIEGGDVVEQVPCPKCGHGVDEACARKWVPCDERIDAYARTWNGQG